MKRLAIGLSALFVLMTIFGLGILAAPANATTPTSCKVYVVEKLHATGEHQVSGKFSSTCSTTIGLVVYGAPSAKFDPKTADQQTFEGVEFIYLAANKIVTATTYVPSCYYQADAFTGDVILKLSATNLYGSRLLSPAATGGSKPCDSSTPTPTVPKSTTTTTDGPHVTAPTTSTTIAATDHDTGRLPAPTATTAAPQLASATGLAQTGFNYRRAVTYGAWIAGIGALLFIAGIALTPADRPRR